MAYIEKQIYCKLCKEISLVESLLYNYYWIRSTFDRIVSIVVLEFYAQNLGHGIVLQVMFFNFIILLLFFSNDNFNADSDK